MRKRMPARMLVLTALFSALTAVGAYIRIPTPLVAFTLQVFFVFMSGVMLGPKYGAISQSVYLAIGLLGLPVFSGGGGPAYVLQPSFGFLLSYIPASALVGKLCCGERAYLRRILFACFAGLAVIYLIGLPYMAVIVNVYLKRDMSAWSIVRNGMLIFLPFDTLKIILTAVLGSTLVPRVRRLGNNGA